MGQIGKLVESYDQLSGPLAIMGQKVERLIEELLGTHSIRVHGVSHRVKTLASASGKMQRTPERYPELSDIHDLLGLRVITFLSNDVSRVVELLRLEFDVDEGRSKDRLEELAPEEFGYLSSHLILRLNEGRARLPEWAPFSERYFEIQVRSLLQHTWAEIEHDLGYKSSVTVPSKLKRRFARVAGLLELADAEFESITSQIHEHIESTQEALRRGNDVPVDRDSIHEFISEDDVVYRLDSAIAKKTGRLLEPIKLNYSDIRAAELLGVGYASVDLVRSDLVEIESQLVEFAAAWLTWEPEGIAPSSEGLSRGISLFYLWVHSSLQTEAGIENLRGSVRDLSVDQIFGALLAVHDDSGLMRTDNPKITR
ncbi:hypothetical protein NHL51_11750 [Leucobacter sp. gxy201]|uniref:GTP pyrophosphokinase n=1 Tax=Leucobacter sp. gxy201 TaxID=2957200 RepID=UPI003DA006B5